MKKKGFAIGIIVGFAIGGIGGVALCVKLMDIV
jgi:hypothetical protein